MVKIQGAISKHEEQLKSQVEQIKKRHMKQENKDKREQQKRLIITGLDEEDLKKTFYYHCKRKTKVNITETDFSLKTKEIRIRPRQNENAQQSTSGFTRNEAINIQWKKDCNIKLCLYMEEMGNLHSQVRVANHRYLPLRRYRCQAACFIF